MSKKEIVFRDELKGLGHIVGEFRNIHGELFVVYKMDELPKTYFCTGDELDWESGWQHDADQLIKVLPLTESENVGIMAIYATEGKIKQKGS